MNGGGNTSWLRSASLAALVGTAGCIGDVPTRVVPGECALDGGDAENERSPGYPYDFEVFKSDIAPMLVADCVNGACHAELTPPSGGNGGFTVFTGAAETDCARVKTFKQLRDKVDLTAPAASRLIFALEGGELSNNVRHPLDYTATEDGQAKLDAITAFITQASETCIAGGGCSPDVRDYFDYQVFQTVIQPGLDAAGDGAGCSATAACHQPPTGQRGFALPAAPEPDSPEMEAAYDAVKARVSLDAAPRATLLYSMATVKHGPGATSTTVDAETAEDMVAWIEAAVRARGEGDDLGCANPARLDLGVFRDEILPILRGTVNLNDRDDDRITTGCTRQTCHGMARPGALTLIDTESIDEQLANFACFVSLTSPASSQVLLCPHQDSRCLKNPHPGDRIFDGGEDLNYQRVLSYLFSAVTDVTPLDFAFYARRVNPMFDDRSAVEDGAQGRTCASTEDCHGIAVAGQPPPNGANFAIIPNAGSDIAELETNFLESVAFINYLSPDQSSLFLYPTDEIADEDNPVATGIHHPGGADFTVDSRFARDILTFAGGLRPGSGGFLRQWLIGGAYSAGDIDDETPVDEVAVRPQVFDDSGGDDLAGRWDGLFVEEDDVDVGAFLGGEVGAGRIAYAVAYVYNRTTIVQSIDVELSSQNEATLYADDSVASIAAGGTISLRIDVPPSRSSDTPTGTRVMVKLFELPADGGMSFRVRLLRADSDAVFDDASGELFIKLGPRGGV